ncbi:MAG: NUDIX domain-containing protein [Candidatus Woesearchaeota archaeon]|jgi:ADP-ribose pyrophosphatase YjhB (NUDIX family)|nr:NUDIX domain-containing protein [Candidatus Woesearchaeota archaeon]
MEEYNFQYCQKIIVLSKDKNSVLLCKRKGEADYDGVFSFIGGKMENTDLSIIEGLKREKDEEVGLDFQVLLYPTFSLNLLFRKKDGNSMILPHYLAIYEKGNIDLNEEYSEYQWIEIDKLNEFEPKISNIPETVNELLRLEKIAKEKEFILI